MFDDMLSRIETMLDVPYPQRGHILRELEADLAALLLAGSLAFLIVLVQAALASGLRAMQVKIPVS
jgi:hypothetical protein